MSTLLGWRFQSKSKDHHRACELTKLNVLNVTGSLTNGTIYTSTTEHTDVSVAKGFVHIQNNEMLWCSGFPDNRRSTSQPQSLYSFVGLISPSHKPGCLPIVSRPETVSRLAINNGTRGGRHSWSRCFADGLAIKLKDCSKLRTYGLVDYISEKIAG